MAGHDENQETHVNPAEKAELVLEILLLQASDEPDKTFETCQQMPFIPVG